MGLGVGARAATAAGFEPPATSAPVSVRIDVRAPRDCATADTFWDALARRTNLLERTTSASASNSIRLELTRHGGWVDGDLTVVRGAETSDRRHLRGSTCEDVIDGLSFIAALAFDEGARLDGDAPTEAERVTTDDAADGALGTEDVAPADDAPADVAPPSKPRPSSATTSLSIGAVGGVARMGVTDAGSVSTTWGALVELAWNRPGVVSPSIRVGATHGGATSRNASVQAELAWTAGRFALCPLRFALSTTMAWRTCAGMSVGVFSARATNLRIATDRSRPWAAPEISVPLRWEPVAPLFIELQAALAVPLVRDEIVVDPNVPVYRAPTLLPSLAVAAGVHFP